MRVRSRGSSRDVEDTGIKTRKASNWDENENGVWGGEGNGYIFPSEWGPPKTVWCTFEENTQLTTLFLLQ